MAFFKGAAKEAQRAALLKAQREKERSEIEMQKKKLEAELKIGEMNKFQTQEEAKMAAAAASNNSSVASGMAGTSSTQMTVSASAVAAGGGTVGLITLDELRAKHEVIGGGGSVGAAASSSTASAGIVASSSSKLQKESGGGVCGSDGRVVKAKRAGPLSFAMSDDEEADDDDDNDKDDNDNCVTEKDIKSHKSDDKKDCNQNNDEEEEEREADNNSGMKRKFPNLEVSSLKQQTEETKKQKEKIKEEEKCENNDQVGDTEIKRCKRYGKNPFVDTSFIPDVDREQDEICLRQKLKEEWIARQSAIKQEEILITWSYWDGSGHRRQIKVRKGDTIKTFLARCLESVRKEFAELRVSSADQLLYVKEDLIIPHHYTFYDFIVTKARGKSGPLFCFDVRDDVRLVSDATVEKEESHAGKVCLRSWYDRNKHIFPASRWEPYDPTKNWDEYSISDKLSAKITVK